MDLMGIISSPYKGCHLVDTLKSTMTPISGINQQQKLINKRQSQGVHSFSTIKYVEIFIRSYGTESSYLMVFKVNTMSHYLFSSFLLWPVLYIIMYKTEK